MESIKYIETVLLEGSDSNIEAVFENHSFDDEYLIQLTNMPKAGKFRKVLAATSTSPSVLNKTLESICNHRNGQLPSLRTLASNSNATSSILDKTFQVIQAKHKCDFDTFLALAGNNNSSTELLERVRAAAKDFHMEEDVDELDLALIKNPNQNHALIAEKEKDLDSLEWGVLYAIACSPSASNEALGKMLRQCMLGDEVDSLEIVDRILGNKNLSPADFKYYLDNVNEDDLCLCDLIKGNNNIDSSLLRKIFNKSMELGGDLQEIKSILNHNNIDKSLIGEITDIVSGFIDNDEIIKIIASHSLTSPSVRKELIELLGPDEYDFKELLEIANNGDFNDALELAFQSTDQNILKILAKKHHPIIQYCMMELGNAGEDVCRILANAKSPLIRFLGQRNLNRFSFQHGDMSCDKLTDISNEIEGNELAQVCRDDCPAQLLTTLSKSSSEDVRALVALHENTPKDILKLFAEDSSSFVRGLLPFNPIFIGANEYEKKILQQLMSDSDEMVRSSAASNMNNEYI